MNAYDMMRIQRLRDAAVEPYINYDEFCLHFYRKLSEAEGAFEARYAQACAYAFEHTTPVIGEDELIVGRPAYRMSDAEQAEWQRLREGIVEEYAYLRGQDSHMAIDYELLLREGVKGIVARIDGYLADCAPEKRPFYEACRICLGGVVAHARRYAEQARAMAESCDDPRRRQELMTISQICARVPEYPAESFYEAVQAAHFISLCLSFAPLRPGVLQQFQLGHPDRYLWPYYQADVESGRITQEQAQVLLDCLGVQINCRVPNGLSCGYMVGGRDRKGNLVANDLTCMGMQVIDDIRLVYPSVGLCWAQGMPEEFLEKACGILSHGRSHPAIFNDDLIVSGLMGYGVPEEDAREYIHSTCVEITPVGGSNVWVASPYTNMLQLLLDEMGTEHASFDALLEAVYSRLDASIQRNFEEQNGYRALRAQKSFNPLLSCFVNDCLARGVDIERGGARYNWIMPSFVGMANLVDSLYVLKKLIFEQQEMTFAQLKQALDANFEGYELLRLKLLNGFDKYGNDVDEVDKYFGQIAEHIVQECRKYKPMLPDAQLIPSVFCWVMHEQFGRQTGASPDGRRAGFPLGDGSGPCQGREKNGPTASVLSSTKWSHREMIGGVAVNMKFSKKTFNEESGRKVRSLVHAYLDRGGFEMQINVVDRETLLKAQQNPEQYRDLVVRIGGYSDYFVKISPQMQAEVLLRTAHEV